MDEKNKKLFENSHLELPSKPTTSGVDYLRYINTIIGAFEDCDTLAKEKIILWTKKHRLGREKLGLKDGTFGNRFSMAKGFGLIEKDKKSELHKLTSDGIDFRDAMNENFKVLSAKQKDILLESLKKGIDSPIKATIFIFMHFLKIREDVWFPKSSELSNEDRKIISKFMNKKKILSSTSIGFLFQWARNYCRELELVEGGSKDHESDLTPLGVEIYNLLVNLLKSS